MMILLCRGNSARSAAVNAHISLLFAPSALTIAQDSTRFICANSRRGEEKEEEEEREREREREEEICSRLTAL